MIEYYIRRDLPVAPALEEVPECSSNQIWEGIMGIQCESQREYVDKEANRVSNVDAVAAGISNTDTDLF